MAGGQEMVMGLFEELGLGWVWPRVWAEACTVCGSGAGRQLRAELFDGGFASRVMLVALPFPILAAAVAIVCRLIPDLGDERAGSGGGA